MTTATLNSICPTIKRILRPTKGWFYCIASSILRKYENLANRYSLRDGASSFAEQARNATFDLAGDEALAKRKRRQLNWDQKKKKFVTGDGAGADNVKMVKTEGGTKLPVTYRSGRFDEWKAKTRVNLPKIGEAEGEGMRRSSRTVVGGRKYKHAKFTAAKPLDKFRHDYERKARQLKKRESGEDPAPGPLNPRSLGKPKRGGRQSRGKSIQKVKSELRTVEQIRKGRKVLEKRK